MTDPTFLPAFLDLALAAGVPAEALERAGFDRNDAGEWSFFMEGIGDLYWSAVGHLPILGYAAERVVIEWLGSPNGVGYVGSVTITETPSHREVNGHEGPTFSAALAAALRQIQEARND